MGIFYSRRLYRRAEWLLQAERLLDSLLSRLTYTAAPLSALWEALAGNEVFSRYPLVRDTVDGLRRSETFGAAFGAALDRALQQGLLQTTERELLFELGDALGRTGLTEQKRTIRDCRERLCERRHAAEELARVRGQIYQVMGIAGGVALALLLL